MADLNTNAAESFWLRFWREPSECSDAQWRGTVWHERQPTDEKPRPVRGPEEAFNLVRHALGLPDSSCDSHKTATFPKALAPHGIRRFLRLRPDEASFHRRGFSACEDKRRILEAAGSAFVAGYNSSLEGEPLTLCSLVAEVPGEWRGFFVEGAAMAVAITDSLHLFGHRLPPFLDAVRDEHAYLAHVGVGWAMARIAWRHSTWMSELDPLLRPLAYDGCGFHDTYFRPDRALAGYRRFRQGYAARAYDQGVGRALWFVCGAEPTEVARTVARFTPDRRPDLWAGVGLAATYIGAEPKDCFTLKKAAEAARPVLAQGAAFAAEARVRAGHVPIASERACSTFTGLCARSAAALVREIRDGLCASNDASFDAYEAWRLETASALAVRTGLG